MGRPPTCVCGHCAKCKRAAYMRAWWLRQSPEKKREYLDRRLERRGDQIRESDRTRRLASTGYKKPPRDPEKRRAKWTMHNALRDGRLVRRPCEVCGAEPAHGHHADYSKPLEVEWLCPKHHMERHRKYGVAA